MRITILLVADSTASGALPDAVLLGHRRWKVRTAVLAAWLLDGGDE